MEAAAGRLGELVALADAANVGGSKVIVTLAGPIAPWRTTYREDGATTTGAGGGGGATAGAGGRVPGRLTAGSEAAGGSGFRMVPNSR